MKYFVSGHRDLTEQEFIEHYQSIIDDIIEQDNYAEFVVGDWEGCDSLFINYLNEELCGQKIHIYYVDNPRVCVDKENKQVLHKRDNYDECDASMTKNSDFDIAWVRPGREDSHTAKNIKRRYNLC